MEILINEQPITIANLKSVLEGKAILRISSEAESKITDCRTFLEEKLKTEKNPIYGINTGFGSLCNTEISKSDLSQLQENLVMSHACGMGDRVPDELVRLMLYFKIHALSLGHSGVRMETILLLTEMFNNDILPVVYQMGSLGASGDLAPLAHLALPLIGKGKVQYNNEVIESSEAFQKAGLTAISLQAKEGLALLNGTQFMSAYGAYLIYQAEKLLDTIAITSAISIDAYDGRIEPFHSAVHKVRPHQGQMTVAAKMKELLEDSEIAKQPKSHVQDPYSFRCIPQVHGASMDSIAYAKSVIEREINSVTDNPTIVPDEDAVISAGNFHGQPIAIVLDFLALALAELGSISERRVFKLVSGTRNLPPFLMKEAGINSGFMIPQYTAASMVSQNKQLCTPAVIDTIDSSNGQEDHVSMGANAATKCYRILENVQRIVGIELFTATQALEFRKPKETSPQLKKIVDQFRSKVPFIETDTIMHDYMIEAERFVKEM